MDDFLKEIQETFLVESQDLLLGVESLFLKLEKNPNDTEVFNQLSRLAHNLKGSGKAVGFVHLSHFCHEFENLILACKNLLIKPTAKTINLLLRSVDEMKLDIETLRGGGVIRDYSKILAEIELELKVDQVVPLKDEIFKSIQPTIAKDLYVNYNQTAEYLRIPAIRIESLIDSFGEQVILQSALEQAKTDLVRNEDVILKTIGSLSKLTYDLQQTALSLRMVKLNQLISKLERAARDTAQSLNKSIHFRSKGTDNELDKMIVDSLSDALTHMVRNAVDHGIESTEERLAAGKKASGSIELNAFRSGGNFMIEIQDDGRGMDPKEIFARAHTLGLIGQESNLSEKQIFDLIFENGFSTKTVATDISGRGVGMNVVKEKILELKGSCEIKSKLGVGTSFHIQLPLTLAIFNALIVRLGTEKFAIPTSDVDEVAIINISDYKKSNLPQELLQLRDQVYSIVDLRKELFQVEVEGRKSQVTALLVKKTRHAFAVLVDEVVIIQKVVQKSLSQDVRQVRGSAGATILGDGSVCLILNLNQFSPKLAENSKNKEAAA